MMAARSHAPVRVRAYSCLSKVLIIFGLWVPLTAFAFLGGALAIGIGYGARNVIKNLISGVIILFERKVRVGDTVTVGSVSGEVIAVDLRATTIRGFDGIEAIIPNSTLLEQQVSNWTSGQPVLRRTIRLRLDGPRSGPQVDSDLRGALDRLLQDYHLALARPRTVIQMFKPPAHAKSVTDIARGIGSANA